MRTNFSKDSLSTPPFARLPVYFLAESAMALPYFLARSYCGGQGTSTPRALAACSGQ
jgi:hypothetical protein